MKLYSKQLFGVNQEYSIYCVIMFLYFLCVFSIFYFSNRSWLMHLFPRYLLQVLSILLVCVTLVSVSAAPRYVLVPIEEYEAMSVRGTRVARQAWDKDQAQEQDGRVERQAHGHGEHVDYGAHTGHHGAFGWYADFPVLSHH